MRRSVWCLIAIAVCVLLGGAYCGFWLHRVLGNQAQDCYAQQAQDCYAQWALAETVIEYMERNDGAWPSDWESLREPHEILAGRSGPPWSLNDLRSRCAIDFEAEPEQLASAPRGDQGPPFRVIWLRNGKEVHWSNAEPNQLILEYLLERASRSPTYVSPKRPLAEERQARLALLAIGARYELDKEGRVTTVRLGSAPGTRRFSDDAMRHLVTLRHLRGLDLGYSNVTDHGLRHLQGLSELRWIYLYGTQVTDEGLRHLVGLTKLETLVLADESFTDRCLEHTAILPELQLLNLNGCRITDDAVRLLREHSNLRQLLLYDTEVSSEGIRELERSLPECKIEQTVWGHGLGSDLEQ